jgi:uncharacterized protein (TIGR02001 family)
MKMNKLMIGTAATAMLVCGGVSANEIEGNVALSTDYVFRGFSQSDENPAISGGFDYGFDSGFYVGTWASSIDFDSATSDGDASTEIDLYAGYAFDLTDSLSLDLSAIYFMYPDATDDLNYEEYIASFGFGDASFGIVYSPEYLNVDTSAIILNAGYSLALAEGISLDFGVGYTTLDDDTKGLSYEGGDDYLDYSVGLTVPFGGVDLSLVGYGTDISDDKLADERVVFSISKSF